MQLEMYGIYGINEHDKLFVFNDENMIYSYFSKVDKSKYDEVYVLETDVGKMPKLKFYTEIRHGKVRRR